MCDVSITGPAFGVLWENVSTHKKCIAKVLVGYGLCMCKIQSVRSVGLYCLEKKCGESMYQFIVSVYSSFSSAFGPKVCVRRVHGSLIDSGWFQHEKYGSL